MFEIKPTQISKEFISNLDFPKCPVEHTEEKKNYLLVALQKAMELGNECHQKFKIIFYDSNDILQVETTVWDLNPESVILKDGIAIPQHRIVDIKL